MSREGFTEAGLELSVGDRSKACSDLRRMTMIRIRHIMEYHQWDGRFLVEPAYDGMSLQVRKDS